MLFAPKESGQGLVEWAIVLCLLVIVVVAIMNLCKYHPKAPK